MIQNVQILRFVAALWVVLFHLLVPLVVPSAYQPDLPAWLFRLSQLGFAGVDLFFVISGAVIAESTRHIVASPAARQRFIAVRFARIYTGWWPFFALYALAYAWWGWPLAEKALGASFFLWPLTNVVNYVLPVLWTLSMELCFYLAVGLLLTQPRERLRLALVTWAAVVLVVVAFDLAQGRYLPAAYRDLTIWRMYFVSPFVLEFVGGFLLCEWLRSRPATPVLPFALGAVAFGAGAAGYHFGGDLAAHGLAEFAHAPERVLLFGGMSGSLVACALLRPDARSRAGRLFARLGDASYALYLSHILVLVSFYLVVEWLAIPASLRAMLHIGALTTVCALAWAHYRLVEHPLYQASKRRLTAALA